MFCIAGIYLSSHSHYWNLGSNAVFLPEAFSVYPDSRNFHNQPHLWAVPSLLLAYRLNRMMEVFSAMACTVEAWYIIYDTHYMLCGRHGYNIGPEEFVYAACNIHCDLPKGMWRLMKMLFFSKIVEAVRMFRECFRTEVCWWQLSWLENYLFFRLSTSCQNSSIKPFYLKTCQYFFKAYQNQRLVQRLKPSRKCCWGMLANILAGPG